MLSLSTLFGLPAHPLLVHIPVVLVPIAAVTAILSIWGKYRTQFAIATAAMSVVGALGALLAADAGEALNEAINKRSEVLRDHMQMGDTAKGVAVMFAFFATVFVAVILLRVWDAPRVRTLANRFNVPKWIAPAALALTVLSGIAATYTIVDAGHSGAKSVWRDKVAAMKSVSGNHGEDD